MIKSGQLNNLPETSGVYLFKRGRKTLYVGKATFLRSRVRSYLNENIIETRGEWIGQMIRLATRVDFRPTDSVLEALILEANLIKKYQPKYNAKEKSDKSFWQIVVTKEKWPRVLLAREKALPLDPNLKLTAVFGPFPKGAELRIALKILRRIFPFRDKCSPESGQSCFNHQLGLCPGVCVARITATEYRRTIRRLKLFFAGKKRQLLRDLEREMKRLAAEQKFEQAGEVKRRIFALRHIQDVALIREDKITLRVAEEKALRIEAYDVSHLAGQLSVGVMVVLEGDELLPSQYRKFRLRTARAGDDLDALREILERRANHPEWPSPDLIVVDGGKTQLAVTRKVLAVMGLDVPTVSVVKDERHRARDVLGDKELAGRHETEILRANQEAHRFAINYHRQLRRRLL